MENQNLPTERVDVALEYMAAVNRGKPEDQKYGMPIQEFITCMEDRLIALGINPRVLVE